MMNRLGNNSKVKQRLGLNPQTHIRNESSLKGGDARFRLIQNKRKHIADARDVLAVKARQGDARQKLNKKKEQNTVKVSQVQPNVQQNASTTFGVGASLKKEIINQTSSNLARAGTFVVKKQNAANPSRSLPVIKKVVPTRPAMAKDLGLQAKTTVKTAPLVRTINNNLGKIKKTTTVSQALLASCARYHPFRSNPNVVTIRNEKVIKPLMEVNISSFAKPSQLKLKAKRTLLQNPTPQVSYASRRGFPNQPVVKPYQPVVKPYQPVVKPYQPVVKPYKGNIWEPQSFDVPSQQVIKPTRLKITTANNYMDFDTPVLEEQRWMQYWTPAQRVQAPKRSSEPSYDYMPPPPKKQAVLSSNIISRLDQPQRSPPPQVYYKVMVTNLHPVVSEEDVEELFQNIGPIKSARIVRDGIAEVLFLNEDDAYRSVEVYHNRQLDGQAMNVSVVSKKAAPPPSRTMQPPSYSLHDSTDSGFYTSNSRPTSMSAMVQASIGSGNRITKSVLRTAGGSTQPSYGSAVYALSQRRAPKADVSPDIGTIHHALFSGRRSGNMNSNLQVYIKLPKQPMRGTK